ncbi:MAG TPA: preprotein translocase subunit YajC [Saprospiraceae bacterium]|nr:preprotein translocase subunit YajC [Saprospiraceae bacterium]HMP13616.1 preprotein translocase subunit YajC [Saprospiraceae bacterium]
MLQTDIILLQGAANGGGMSTSLLFMGAMLLIFWLFLIRPQAKRQREQKQFTDNMEKGDEVVTSSGILGRINKIEQDIVILEVGNKNYIRVLKSAISKEMTEGIHAGLAKNKKADDKDKKSDDQDTAEGRSSNPA